MKIFHFCAEHMGENGFIWDAVVETNLDVFSPDFIVILRGEIAKKAGGVTDVKNLIIRSLTLIGER